ncbi:acyl-CoA dehydrogenase family protein [Labrys wisconsinensis]|uniref:Alkylation response protein AidB-like acyl-CoA dehydrogenase n=1 Tax=Labrys wisconsinensis TaxID=425677 RepID=A0ABU0JM21_9HYPH|nr:acyl-CoA dehydrogenase family protein [Labrys wisconsinensis]MDQ0475345.1 alkylation response protein AidB-like acyl-CoA dehydrogenase [Labrys wisconsinensis]
MSFGLPPSALAWRAKVRRFVDEELIPHEVEAEMSGGELAPALLQRHEALAIGLGLARMDAPRRHGGLELPLIDQVAAAEQIGRVTNALGWCYPEAQSWMFEACDAGQIERFVLPMMRGERHFCYAITEEFAGSDVSEIATTATPDGDDVLISGEKWHVTSENLADVILVQARIGGDGGQALFFVEKGAPGIAVKRSPAYSHTYRHHHPILAFDRVRVPQANLIGPRDAGMTFAYAWFRRERLMIAARCCGAMERLVEETAAFARARRVGGEALIDKQLIAAMLADSLVDLQAARLITYEAAAAHDAGLDLKTLHARCSIAKLFASEAAGRVADRCVQVFGGRGYMRENVAERFWRELRVDRIWEGASEIQRLIIANALAKRGVDGTIGGT